MVLEELGVHRQMNLDLNLMPNAKVNSKWVMDLNINCRTVKLTDQSVEYLHDARLVKSS